MNNLMGNIGSILSVVNAMKSGTDPKKFAENMMLNNPQFKSFYEANKGKSVEQIAQDNNLDMNMIQSILNNIK